MPIEIIPPQKDGGKSDNTYSVTCFNEHEAINLFRKSAKRLLDVNNWENICDGIIKANFKLCDELGKNVDRLAKETDYFKIDIPGPGPVDGEGYDWVRIESISTKADKINDADLISIRVRPASCPLNNKQSIAHFFTNTATTTFLIKRKGCLVTAEIHGRNEKPNEHTVNIIDAVRNKVVANGAILSFSDIQWKQLVIAFLS